MSNATTRVGNGSSILPLASNKLFDLVQFRWDQNFRCFVKAFIVTSNVTKSIAYAKKKSLIFHGVPGLQVFQVCPNGTYQYKNRLIAKRQSTPKSK